MYKVLKNKKFRLVFNKFPISAKSVSGVYITGFHKWHDESGVVRSIVAGRFRIMLTINNKCCGEIK